MTVYVFSRDTLIVCTPTPTGYRTRSTRKADFHHDYVSGESFVDVSGWLDAQLNRFESVTDRQEALERLATPTGWPGGLGFLQGAAGEGRDPYEAAERVLQHLECGW
jgi:hypothetical protein